MAAVFIKPTLLKNKTGYGKIAADVFKERASKAKAKKPAGQAREAHGKENTEEKII